MASTLLLHLQNVWPFSILKSDDLKFSERLVRKLSLPQQTKQFVFVVREPESNNLVYILAAQNLSEQSAFDSENLIKEVDPKAVIVQIAPSALTDIQAEEKNSREDQLNIIPTSSIGVLKRCLTDKINKEQYDKFAGCQVLQEIFGVGFYGHFLAAKRAAEDVDSCFLLLESPYERSCTEQTLENASSVENNSGWSLQPNCLLPGKETTSINSSSLRFCLTDTLQLQMVSSLVPSLNSLLQETNSSEAKPINNYEAPQPFAQSVYPLLADLYHIFNDLPAINRAFASAQKMLANINKGEPVDTQLLSEVHNFRIAIESLRIALNNAAKSPINKTMNKELEFAELSSDEKCHVLFAQALKSQVRKFDGPIVAIVDTGSLAGLRRHWRTSVPQEIVDFAAQCSIHNYSDDYLDNEEEESETDQKTGKKRLLKDKPMVAVGAGATAVLGATSLSKAVPASTLIKITTYKVPAVLKLGLTTLKRQAYMGVTKILGPINSTALKLAFSSEKIRVVTHSVIASAERTSLLAIRSSFYEIMRRRSQAFRFAPWTTFGCSIAACSVLIVYGDGIECAAESVPSVPTIASLGRGIQSLKRASEEVRQTSRSKIHEALQSLMHNLNTR